MRPICLLLLLTPPLAAHDLWLIPPEKADAGKMVTVRAVSGSAFPVGDHAPDPANFARRLAIGPDGNELDVAAAGKEELAGVLAVMTPRAGVYVVAVETKPKVISLAAEKFNEYLVSDGLPHIYLLRAKEKSLDRPGVERYSKSPKALVKVGIGDGDATKPVGLPLEIVPLKDPFAKKVGEALPIRVLFQGKPLAEANLGWAHPGDGETARGTVRTNEKGEALIPIAKPGLMTVRLTHMTRPKTADYEWESFWTTLTWRVE